VHKARGVPAIADAHGIPGDAQAARIGGFFLTDGHENIGGPAAQPFQAEGKALPPYRPRLVEQESVAGIGHARHPGRLGRRPRQQPGDGHVPMHQVELLFLENPGQRVEGLGLGDRVQTTGEGHGDDAEALGTRDLQHRAIGA
jgi:hypothetical protein